MTIQLLNKAGDTLTTFSFKPAADQRVLVNGQEKVFHNLRVGEKITIWVSEKRLEAVELPGSTEDSWAVLPPHVQIRRKKRPGPASPMPPSVLYGSWKIPAVKETS
jgi:hypothetical protein